MLSPLKISVCLFALVQLGLTKYQCPQAVHSRKTKTFIDQLAEILNTVYGNLNAVKPDSQVDGYLRSIEQAFEQSFAGHSCSYTPSNAADIVAANQNLTQYLEQSYRFKTPLSPTQKADVLQVVNEAETFLRLMLKKRSFSTCFVSEIRDAVVEHLADCYNEDSRRPDGIAMRIDINNLRDVPMPDISDPKFERRLYAFVIIFAKGFLQAANCDEAEIPQIVGQFSTNWLARVEGLPGDFEHYDMCDAALDTLDDCLCIFGSGCQVVTGCIHQLVNDFGASADQDGHKVFQFSQWAKTCARLAREDGMGELLKQSIRLYNRIRKIMKEQDPALKKEVKKVTKTIINANFRVEACGCEHSTAYKEEKSALQC